MRTPVADRGRDPWTAEMELLAQLIEVVSIGVAERAIPQPIRIPRPDSLQVESERAERADGGDYVVTSHDEAPEDNPYRSAIHGLVGSSPRRPRVVPSSSTKEQSA